MNHHTHSAFRRACQHSWTAVLLCINILARTDVLHAQGTPTADQYQILEKMKAMDADLGKAKSDFVNETRTIPEGDPAYAKSKQKFSQRVADLRTKYNANQGKRFTDYSEYMKQAGVAEDFLNTGSRPKGIYSDQDFTATKEGAAETFVDFLRGKGRKIIKLRDRYVDPDSLSSIWPAEPNLPSETAERRALFRLNANAEDVFAPPGAKYKVSGGIFGTENPVGYSIANAKKLNDAVRPRDPSAFPTPRTDLLEDLAVVDSRTAGKSIYKAIDPGKVPQPFFNQADALRVLEPAIAYEEAGITGYRSTPQEKSRDIRQWLAQGETYVAEAVVSAQVESVKLAAKKGELVKRLLGDGLRECAADVIRPIADAMMINQEVICVIGRSNPEQAAKMLGKYFVNSDGSFINKVTGKDMSPSEIQEAIRNAANKMGQETIRQATGRGPKIPTEPTTLPEPLKPVEPLKLPESPINRFGGRFLMYAGALFGAFEGAQRAVDEEKPGEGPSTSRGLIDIGTAEATEIVENPRSGWRRNEIDDMRMGFGPAITWGQENTTHIKATLYGIGYAVGVLGVVDSGINDATEIVENPPGWRRSDMNDMRMGFGPAVTVVKGLTLDPILSGAEGVVENEMLKHDSASADWAALESKLMQHHVHESTEERARKTEGAEARTRRLSEAENVFQRRGIPVVPGGKVQNAAQENERLKQSNPDGYNHRLALILTEFDRLAIKLKRDEAINDERPRAKDEIYKLLQQKYTNTPQEFQKALALQYSKYNKNYAIAPTPQELAGKWNGGRMTVRSANFGANSGCTPEMQAKLDTLRGQAIPLDLNVQTDANGNGSLSLGFAPGASALTGQEGPTRVPFQFKDGKIQGEVAQAGGRVFKVDGELVRTDSGWALNGSWQMSASIEGSTVMLIKGDLSASK